VIARYEFIDAQKALYPVVLMCRWAAVSRSGFYDWCSRPTSATAARRRELQILIAAIFDDSDGTYGYRRVHAELTRGQVACSPELVRAVMRDLGLCPCQPKPFRPATTIAGDAAAVPDLVARDFTADAPGTKLVGDITYIATWRGWAYLATVIDCHTKACIGWAIADHMRTDLVCDALDMASRNYELAEDCIFHSDRPWHAIHVRPIRQTHHRTRYSTVCRENRSLLRQCARRIIQCSVESRASEPHPVPDARTRKT
jgi:putative transposase